MKKLILAFSLILAIAVTATAAPSIYTVLPVFNFGTVVDGYAVIHTFVLQNTGDEPLKISRVTSSCGCTTAALPTDTIAPGETVDLTVTVNTTSFGGRTITKLVTVVSNDPEKPTFTLQVTGQVLASAPHLISAADAQYYAILLIDLRPEEEYAAHHILGAVNMAPEDVRSAVAGLSKDTFIILYDADFTTSGSVALELRALENNEAFMSSFALVGGLDRWVSIYGMRFLTNADTPYDLPSDYDRQASADSLQHYMSVDAFNSLYWLYIDVRDPEAYAGGHILSAINIPADDLAASTDLLPQDIPLVVYDQDNTGSEDAALWLINNGFGMAQGILGGLDEWIRQYGDVYFLTGAP